MPFLDLGGRVVRMATFQEEPPTWRGEVVRAYDQNLLDGRDTFVRRWGGDTPPIPAAAALALSRWVGSGPVLCSGDALLGEPVLCVVRYEGGQWPRTRGGAVRPVRLALEEVQPAILLPHYLPGNSAGFTFTRASTAFRVTDSGILASVGANVLRDTHYVRNAAGVYERALLLEDAGANAWLWSEDMTAAGVWVKAAATIAENATLAPDGALTADKLVEDLATNAHGLEQAMPAVADNSVQTFSFHLAPAGRDWVRLVSIGKDAVTRNSWVNLATGVVGTVGAGHSVTVRPMAHGFHRVSVTFNAGAGAGAARAILRMATGDGSSAPYAGNGTSGVYVWGAMLGAAGSYIPTAGAAAVRAADAFALTGTWASQTITQYTRSLDPFTGVASETLVTFVGTQPQALVLGRAYTHVKIEPGTRTLDVMRALALAAWGA